MQEACRLCAGANYSLCNIEFKDRITTKSWLIKSSVSQRQLYEFPYITRVAHALSVSDVGIRDQ